MRHLHTHVDPNRPHALAILLACAVLPATAAHAKAPDPVSCVAAADSHAAPTPVPDRRPPFLEVAGGAGGAAGLGPGWQLSARYTYWVTPWLGVGPKLRTGYTGMADAFLGMERLDSTSASGGVSLRSAGPHADFILSTYGGVASVWHTNVATGDWWNGYTLHRSTYWTPELAARAAVHYRSWSHVGLVFALGVRYDVPGPDTIQGYDGFAVTGTLGLAFR